MLDNSVVVSIVSHFHGDMIIRLVEQLLGCKEVKKILVTCNVPEALELPEDSRIVRIDNPEPKGFGANHNSAYQVASEDFNFLYFCPLNPDIQLPVNPFPTLLNELLDQRVGLVAPLVLSVNGEVEDSVRRFPKPGILLAKAAGGGDGRYEVLPGQASFYPEWIAGMFMLFRRDIFVKLGGFDEGFFLYYEDVDICVRTWQQGSKIAVCPSACVVHNAQRASHRNFRFMRWHLASMLRYFWKHWGRLPKVVEQ